MSKNAVFHVRANLAQRADLLDRRADVADAELGSHLARIESLEARVVDLERELFEQNNRFAEAILVDRRRLDWLELPAWRRLWVRLFDRERRAYYLGVRVPVSEVSECATE